MQTEHYLLLLFIKKVSVRSFYRDADCRIVTICWSHLNFTRVLLFNKNLPAQQCRGRMEMFSQHPKQRVYYNVAAMNHCIKASILSLLVITTRDINIIYRYWVLKILSVLLMLIQSPCRPTADRFIGSPITDYNKQNIFQTVSLCLRNNGTSDVSCPMLFFWN